MKNPRKLFGIISIIAVIVCVITACELFETPNQTPVAGDYDIANLKQSAGSVTAVSVTPKSGKSSGARTIYYEGTNGLAKSTAIPQDDGAYAVTFDVAAASGWNAASGLYAGTLIVGIPTPVASDFTVSNLIQTTGKVTAVSITPKAGRSTGKIKIYYTGTGNTNYQKSETVPTGAASGSEYAVTFDVAEANGWKAATGLSAGTLEINNNKTPVVADYHIDGLGTFTNDGKEKKVTVTRIDETRSSPGSVTVKYNGNTAVPKVEGTFAVTFDVAAANGWNAASNLTAGTLNIQPANSAGTKTLEVTIIAENETPKIGDRLTVDVIKNFSGKVTYQWRANSQNIEGETNNHYNLRSGDWGKAITVKVTCGDMSRESPPVTVQSPLTYTVWILPRFGWDPSEGDVVKGLVAYASINDYMDVEANSDNGFSCQWLRDNANISGATNSVYMPQNADAGKTIKVKVSGGGRQNVNSNEIEMPPARILGTWIADIDFVNEGFNFEGTCTLNFTSLIRWEMIMEYTITELGLGDTSTSFGIYTVDGNDLAFTDDWRRRFSGEISDTTIVLFGKRPDGGNLEFTKQP